MQKLLTFFSKNISLPVYATFNDQSLNNMLTNDVVSFEQLGPSLSNRIFNLHGDHPSVIVIW